MIDSLRAANHALLAGKYRKALKIYEKAIADSPSNALAYQGAAQCLLGVHKYETAYDRSQQALQLDGNLPLPHVVQAYVYLAKNELEKSLMSANKAVQMDPNSADALECYGTVLLYHERFDEAIEALDRSVAINPRSILAHHNLGYIYKMRNEMTRSLYHAKAIFSIKPSLRTSYELILAYIGRYATITTISLLLLIGASYLFRLKILLLVPLVFVALAIYNSFVMIKNRDLPAAVRSFFLAILFGIPSFYILLTR